MAAHISHRKLLWSAPPRRLGKHVLSLDLTNEQIALANCFQRQPRYEMEMIQSRKKNDSIVKWNLKKAQITCVINNTA